MLGPEDPTPLPEAAHGWRLATLERSCLDFEARLRTLERSISSMVLWQRFSVALLAAGVGAVLFRVR